MYKKESGRKLRVLNLRKDPQDLRDYKYTNTIKDYRTMKKFLETLPNSVDHTNEMSPVKDQGYLGSCVSFSLCAVKEWQEQKEHKEEVEAGKRDHRDNKYYDLSEAWLYWMIKKIDPWPNEEGTSERYAMKVLQKIGVPCEKAWPYDDMDYGDPKNWASLIARWSLVDSYYRIDNLDQLRGALVNGPVSMGIGCYEEIFYPDRDGYVPYPAHPEYCYGGHAICGVAFNNDTRLIKFKNSWSRDWGKDGYGYLSYKYIKNFMWDAWTCKDLSVTKDMLKGARNLLN